MAEETILELIQKLQRAFEERINRSKPLNSNEINEAYHNKSLMSLHEIEKYNFGMLKQLDRQVNHTINCEVSLSNLDVNIQNLNAKFDKLLEMIECSAPYKQFVETKVLQSKAEELIEETQKQNNPIENMSLSDPKFKLPYNSKFVLNRHGIKTIKQLVALSERDLMRLENIGVVRVRKIQEALDRLNLKLKEL